MADELALMERQVKAHESIAKSLIAIVALMEFPPYVSKDERHFDGQPYVRTSVGA